MNSTVNGGLGPTTLRLLPGESSAVPSAEAFTFEEGGAALKLGEDTLTHTASNAARGGPNLRLAYSASRAGAAAEAGGATDAVAAGSASTGTQAGAAGALGGFFALTFGAIAWQFIFDPSPAGDKSEYAGTAPYPTVPHQDEPASETLAQAHTNKPWPRDPNEETLDPMNPFGLPGRSATQNGVPVKSPAGDAEEASSFAGPTANAETVRKTEEQRTDRVENDNAGGEAPGEGDSDGEHENVGRHLFGRHAEMDTLGMIGPGLPVTNGLDGNLVRDLRNDVRWQPIPVPKWWSHGTPGIQFSVGNLAEWEAALDSAARQEVVQPVVPNYMLVEKTLAGKLTAEPVTLNTELRKPVFSSYTYNGEPVLLRGGHTYGAYATALKNKIDEDHPQFEWPLEFDVRLPEKLGPFDKRVLPKVPGTIDMPNGRSGSQRYILGVNYAKADKAAQSIRERNPEQTKGHVLKQAFLETPAAELRKWLGYDTVLKRPTLKDKVIESVVKKL